VFLLLPPNRLAIPEISPPSPTMLPNPLLNALATPPDAVFVSKLVHSLPGCDVPALLLEGDPNLITVGTVFAPIEDVRVSPGLVGLMVFSATACGRVMTLVGANSLLMLWPSIFWLAN
jgi:hypothetical protein